MGGGDDDAMSTTKTRSRAGRGEGFGPATKADQAELRRQAKAGDDMLAEIYESGVAEGRRSSSSRSSSKKKRSSTKRRPARRSRRRPNRKLTRGAKQVVGPAAADISSGMGLVGAVFGLLLLYLALTSAPAVTGVFETIQKGLRWLSDPTTSIPYRN